MFVEPSLTDELHDQHLSIWYLNVETHFNNIAIGFDNTSEFHFRIFCSVISRLELMCRYAMTIETKVDVRSRTASLACVALPLGPIPAGVVLRRC